MFQVRIHGRGGQGVVSAAEILSVAAFYDGKHAQAFPSFGSERTGAPVMAFCRIHEKPIRLREPIMSPDALIIQDATLLHQSALFEGLSPDGFMLLNSTRSFEELGLSEFVAKLGNGHSRVVAASELAIKHLGRPLPNAALLGGFVALTGRVSLESVERAIEEKFPGPSGKANAEAAREAHALVAMSLENPYANAN